MPVEHRPGTFPLPGWQRRRGGAFVLPSCRWRKLLEHLCDDSLHFLLVLVRFSRQCVAGYSATDQFLSRAVEYVHHQCTDRRLLHRRRSHSVVETVPIPATSETCVPGFQSFPGVRGAVRGYSSVSILRHFRPAL